MKVVTYTPELQKYLYDFDDNIYKFIGESMELDSPETRHLSLCQKYLGYYRELYLIANFREVQSRVPENCNWYAQQLRVDFNKAIFGNLFERFKEDIISCLMPCESEKRLLILRKYLREANMNVQLAWDQIYSDLKPLIVNEVFYRLKRVGATDDSDICLIATENISAFRVKTQKDLVYLRDFGADHSLPKPENKQIRLRDIFLDFFALPLFSYKPSTTDLDLLMDRLFRNESERGLRRMDDISNLFRSDNLCTALRLFIFVLVDEDFFKNSLFLSKTKFIERIAILIDQNAFGVETLKRDSFKVGGVSNTKIVKLKEYIFENSIQINIQNVETQEVKKVLSYIL